MRRFYDDQPFNIAQPAGLSEHTSRHISRVLRMQPGDEIVLFNGHGGEWQARIDSIDKRHVHVVPLQHQPDDRTPSCKVHLALPLIKGDRMDYALQKATELGATSFQLLSTERTDVRLDGGRTEKRMHHWQQVVVSACEQCGLNRIPAVQSPIVLSDYLQQQRDGNCLIAHPGEAAISIATLQQSSSIHLLTGPEGGFSPAEIEMARAQGFQPFSLGQRVLRAETAPTALLAAIWMARGG